MKLKIQVSEGFHTWIMKKSIEIETDEYPELSGKSKEEVLEYLRSSVSEIPFVENGLRHVEDWTLYEELMEQEKEFSKEKNYETNIHLDE